MSTPHRIDGTRARVAARRLSDGAVEFGVQVRQSDDTRGPRLLPDRRWFPADAAVDRWLVSSPVRFAAATGLSPRDGPLEEALAVARRLAPEIVAPTDCVPAPLDDPDIAAGVAVQAGEILGSIGNTGTEHDAAHNPNDGIHLHWELHINDRYLAAGLTPQQTRTVYTALLANP